MYTYSTSKLYVFILKKILFINNVFVVRKNKCTSCNNNIRRKNKSMYGLRLHNWFHYLKIFKFIIEKFRMIIM